MDLKHRKLEFRMEGNTLIDFFCEDKDTFKLDECFRIFQDFCLKFKKAVQVHDTCCSFDYSSWSWVNKQQGLQVEHLNSCVFKLVCPCVVAE